MELLGATSNKQLSYTPQTKQYSPFGSSIWRMLICVQEYLHACMHPYVVHLICMQSQHHSSPPPHRFLSFPHPAFHLSPPQLFIFPSTMQLSVTCKCTTKSWVETWKQVCQDSDIIICMSILRLCRFYSRSSQLYSCINLNMYSRPSGIAWYCW